MTGGNVFGLETAATWQSLFWQGELYHYTVERRGLSDVDFDGVYGQFSWTLTGEFHVYNPQAAAYYRITPKNPFSLSGGSWGAWELAGRMSYVNLNDNFVSGKALTSQPDAVNGSKQLGFTFGVNWYPNDLIRLMLDYNHDIIDKANGTAVKGAPLGAPIGAKVDAIALRTQVAF